MTVYRVAGKTAKARIRLGDERSSWIDYPLPPGTVITGEFEEIEELPKRRRGYADKRVKPTEDKGFRPTETRADCPEIGQH